MTLTTYSGRVQLKGHPGAIPATWEDFAMKSDNDQEMILDVRAWARQMRFGQAKGLYFFCVKGEITSTYSVKVREFD